MKTKLLPIHILVIFLQLLTLGAMISRSGLDFSSWLLHIRNLALLFGSAFLIQSAIRQFIDPTASFRFEHRLITTLILFLLFDPTSAWWVFPIVRIVTELAQYFLRTPAGPLFNPAALGVGIVSLFGLLPSWWGTNPSPRILLFGAEISVAAFFTVAMAGYVIYRYRKLTISLLGLGIFALLYAFLFGQSPLYSVFEGTLLFFFLVMVPEPKTAPVLPKEQVIFGLLVGALVTLGLYFHLAEAYVTALLLGNLYTGRRFLVSLFRTPVSVDARPNIQ